MRTKKILIIGPLLPPLGGISIHIDRISKLLINDFDIEFVDESKTIKVNIFNIRSLNLLKYLQKVKNSDLIYIHSGSHNLRIFHLIAAWMLSKKIILTIHAYPSKKRGLSRYIDQKIYQFANIIIVVNSEILERISLPREKCLIKYAFLPPNMDSEPSLPSTVTNWINERKEYGRIIVCANAWQIDIFDSYDLYGLDMCIQAVNNLCREGFPISFVFNVSSLEKHKNLYFAYHKKIKDIDLVKNFLLINEKLSFVKLIEQSDIVLRPTNTDGDAITVREALYLGKPIIASDVVKRPTGTTLFNTRDTNDLEVKLRTMMSLVQNKSITSQNVSKIEYRKFYKELIDKTINNN